MNEKDVFSKYSLAVKKIIKHQEAYYNTLDILSNLDGSESSKELRYFKRKVKSHERAVNHNYVKCERYNKIIKIFGRFRKGDILGSVLAQVLSMVEGEAYHFLKLQSQDKYQGVIVRELDGSVAIKLPEVLFEYTDTIVCYGDISDRTNACLQVLFGDFPYMKDYLDAIIQYRYVNGIIDDGDFGVMEECYLNCFLDFASKRLNFIQSNYEQRDKEFLMEDCDIFLRQRVN